VKRARRFFKTTILGGVVVILPVVLTILFLKWLFNFVIGFIRPFTALIVEGYRVQQLMAYLLVITIILLLCFTLGLLVKTRLGNYIYGLVERRILRIAPGYSLFRETIKQFLGQSKRPFSRVALVQIFENSALATAFITDEHENGRYTVFVPSGLNPTSGMIYHLKAQYVHIIDVSVEETMRSIIGCGAGSKQLLEKLDPDKGSYKPRNRA
jgi:uncharacterized membrane protein